MTTTPVAAGWHAILVLAEAVSPQTELASNGLVATESDRANVYTGVWGGDVSVTSELLTHAPEDSGDWEAVVEFSAQVTPDHPLQMASRAELWYREPIATHPGTYAVRVSARVRDTEYDGVADGTEEYLVQAWPSPHTPLRVLRRNDKAGQGFRD